MSLTAVEAASIVNVSPRNFRQKLIEGKVRGTKTATGWRVEASDLAAFQATRNRPLGLQLDLPGGTPTSETAPRSFAQRVDQIVEDCLAGRLERAEAIQFVLSA